MKTFKTRLVAGGDVVTTNATINWDGVTDEQLKSLAMRSVVIATQDVYRTAGHVPSTDTIDVAKMLTRERAAFKQTPESMAARAAKMTPEERFHLMQLLERQ